MRRSQRDVARPPAHTGRHDVRVTFPRPDDDASLQLAVTSFRLLCRTNQWPTFRVLDDAFEKKTGLEAETILHNAPAGLFYGLGSGNAVPPDSQEIAVSIAGLSAIDEAAEDVRVFLELMEYAVELWDENPAGAPNPSLTSEAAAKRIPFASGRADLLARAQRVLTVEAWGRGSSTGPASDGTWTFEVTRNVRRLRGVDGVEDYWVRTHPDPAPDDRAPESQADQASRVRAWMELHATPPRAVVVNASEAEIFNIVPTIGLAIVDDTDELEHYFGGNALGRVAEISPGGAYVYELPHLDAVAREPGARSTMHIEFDDARGQRWQLAHGRVIAVDGPRGNPTRLAGGVPVPARDLDLSGPVSAFVSETDERVAFLSYVHQDTAEIDRLQKELEAAGIRVWRDKDELIPGDNLRMVIRDAISTRSFAFISCFSKSRAQRDQTAANEELGDAIEILKGRTSSNWFIPVALDDHPLPDIHLGPLHGPITGILRANLYEPGRETELAKLIAALHRLT